MDIPQFTLKKRELCVLQEDNVRVGEADSGNLGCCDVGGFQKNSFPSSSSSPLKKRARKIVIEDNKTVPRCSKLSLRDDIIDVCIKEFEVVDNGLKILCKLACSEELVNVRLEGIWASSVLKPLKHLRLISPIKSLSGELIVNDENGVVIVESDELVPCTSVSQAVFCRRKAVINQRFRGGNQANKAMLFGIIIHSLFQAAVKRKPRFLTRAWLIGVWKREIRDSCLTQLVALNLTFEEVEESLVPYMDTIISWVQKYIGRNEVLPTGSRILNILDVEENIWDPVIGIKGKVDVTLEVENENGEVVVEPLELKTGKSTMSAEHYGQRFVGDGTLLYLMDGTTRRVRPKENELKGILQMRNELAVMLSDLSEDSFPAPLSDTRLCARCEHAVTCLALQMTAKENSENVCSTLELSKQILSHLSSKDLEYFRKWIRWIFLEWNVGKAKKCDIKDIWRISTEKRELNGRCLAGLKVVEVKDVNNRLVVQFRKSGGKFSLTVFSQGDMVVVSTESSLAVTMGFISAVGEDCIEVLTDTSAFHFDRSKIFVLDRYDSNSVYPINLSNISFLMQNAPIAQKIRSLLIEMRKPIFGKMSKEMVSIIAPLVKKLNAEQALAVLKSLMAEDYAVIEGLPGTGKTSTIVVLTQCLVRLGRSVLITSYTHSAVDNLLAKMVEVIEPSQILRLGNIASVRSELQYLTLEDKLKGESSNQRIELAKRILENTPIVACTCLEVASNVLFSFRRFSTTVVDEASQALESVLIPSINSSNTFILVGDSLQLAPLVQSKEARQEGMAVSLLERLRKHNCATVALCSQYRMNKTIAQLSSKLFYEEKMVCANDEIAESHLALSAGNLCIESKKKHILRSISSSPQDAVIFVDTQSTCSSEYRFEIIAAQSGCYNEGEIKLVQELCNHFQQAGMTEEDIGVISVYRYHAEMLRKVVNKSIEVNTVDQFQGRDKAVIIVSFVWTRSDCSSRSELLSDPRRINVALTRAKQKLVLVGCRESLISFPTIAALVKLIPEENFVSVADVF